MENIIKILMNRDDMLCDKAKEMYLNFRSELMDTLDGTSCLDPKEVLASELGLETDYIFDFLCMAYCIGATKENAKEIAGNITILEISKCISEIRNMMCKRSESNGK